MTLQALSVPMFAPSREDETTSSRAGARVVPLQHRGHGRDVPERVAVKDHDAKADFARALGFRLREARTQRGLTLRDVEKRSGKAFTSVALGSYERGERALSVARMVELAAFYGMPAADLLPTDDDRAATATPVIAIDLLKVAKLPLYQAGPLMECARNSTARDGTTFTLRGDEMADVARVYALSPDELIGLLDSWGVAKPVNA